jgi:hypothetical protein
MKKKVRKFGSGGDILTALGAGLAGYGAYKYLTRDNQGKDTKTGLEAGIKAGEKANEEKEVEKKAPPKREEYKPVGNEGKEDIFKNMPKYKKPEGPAAQDVSGRKPVSVVNKPKDRRKSSSSSSSSSSDSSAAVTEQAQKRSLAAPEDNKDRKSKPFPSDEERRAKKAAVAKAADEKAYKDYVYPGAQKAVRETFPYSDMGDPRGTPSMRARNADPKRAYLKEMADKGKAKEAERKRLEEAEAEKKRRNRPSSEEMMTQSLGGGFKRGGSVSSASKRADGIAIRGKTRA